MVYLKNIYMIKYTQVGYLLFTEFQNVIGNRSIHLEILSKKCIH